MKICKNCNRSYEDPVVFCPKCETTLEDAEPLETTAPTETTESGESVLEKPVKKGGNILPVVALICSVFSVQCWCMVGGSLLTALAAVAVVLSVISLVKKIGSRGIAIASIGIAIMGVLINLLLVWSMNRSMDQDAGERREFWKTTWTGPWSDGFFEEWLDASREEWYGDVYEDR